MRRSNPKTYPVGKTRLKTEIATAYASAEVRMSATVALRAGEEDGRLESLLLATETMG